MRRIRPSRGDPHGCSRTLARRLNAERPVREAGRPVWEKRRLRRACAARALGKAPTQASVRGCLGPWTPACALSCSTERARLPVSQVVGRRVALKRQGREYVALSPFKAEKTLVLRQRPEGLLLPLLRLGRARRHLHVRDDGRGVLPEAVERLAQEAGVPLPAPEARQPEREDERQRLYALLEAAAQFFEEQLKAADGAEARALLAEARRRSRGHRTLSGSAMRPVPGRRCARPWRAGATARRT